MELSGPFKITVDSVGAGRQRPCSAGQRASLEPEPESGRRGCRRDDLLLLLRGLAAG